MNIEAFYKQFLKTNPYPRNLNSFSFENEENPVHIIKNGRKLINFSSNDYLGLSKHPLLINRSQEFIQKYGSGFSSSRLVTGNHELFDEIELQLAKVLNKPAALILPSGYQTNFTLLEALFSKSVLNQKPLVFCDKNCHVSMQSMLPHLSELKRFQHNDLDHLERLLKKYIATDTPKFILVESVYSMDGDQADLKTIIELSKQYQAMLYVDDAHGVGLYGENGWGLAPDYSDDISFIMGTFSKGLGGFGGYVGCSQLMKEYFINKCRGLIYSTAIPPGILGSIYACIELVPTLKKERDKIFTFAKKIRDFFTSKNMNIGAGSTHIIPWIIGDADRTMLMAATLEKAGIIAMPIRPPSVPNGQSRLRFCVSAAHSEEDIDRLLNAVASSV